MSKPAKTAKTTAKTAAKTTKTTAKTAMKKADTVAAAVITSAFAEIAEAKTAPKAVPAPSSKRLCVPDAAAVEAAKKLPKTPLSESITKILMTGTLSTCLYCRKPARPPVKLGGITITACCGNFA